MFISHVYIYTYCIAILCTTSIDILDCSSIISFKGDGMDRSYYYHEFLVLKITCS